MRLSILKIKSFESVLLSKLAEFDGLESRLHIADNLMAVIKLNSSV